MAGSPKKRARREAIERGDLVPDPEGHKSKRAPANKTPLTPEIVERVVGMVRSGMWFVETAIAATGADRSVFRRWMQDGARDIDRGIDSIEADFVRQLEQARAESEVRRVARIDLASTDRPVETIEYDAEGKIAKRVVKVDRGDWRAAAFALERMQPERYAQQIRLGVERELESIVDALEAALDPAAFQIVLTVMAKKLESGEAT